MKLKFIWIIIFLMCLCSPLLAQEEEQNIKRPRETPFKKSSGILRFSSEYLFAAGRIKVDSVTFEMGEVLSIDLPKLISDHEHAFLGIELLIEQFIIKEFWLRPRITLEPTFLENSSKTIDGLSELSIGAHLIGPIAGNFEKEVNLWGWFYFGKEHNGPFFYGIDTDLRFIEWLSFKLGYFVEATRSSPFEHGLATSRYAIELILQLDTKWVITISGIYKATFNHDKLTKNPIVNNRFLWQLGIEFWG